MSDETAQYLYKKMFIDGGFRLVKIPVVMPDEQLDYDADLELVIEDENKVSTRQYMKSKGVSEEQISLLLSEKELMFCENIASGIYQTDKESVIQAGFTSKNSARTCARLLGRENIQLKIGELRIQRQKAASIKSNELISVHKDIRDSAMDTIPVVDSRGHQIDGKWKRDLPTAHIANKFLAQLTGLYTESSTMSFKISNDMIAILSKIYGKGSPAFQMEWNEIVKDIQSSTNGLEAMIVGEVVEGYAKLNHEDDLGEDITQEEFERMSADGMPTIEL